MASPIGHTLSGLGLAVAVPSGTLPTSLWMLAAVFAANAPDLDFLPGLAVGEANRWHQGPSHSLSAAVLLGVAGALAAGVLARRATDAVRLGVLLAAGHASHLLLDLLGQDHRPPFGIPLLWPFSDARFASPWPVFASIRHGGSDATPLEFFGSVLCLDNLAAAFLEIVVLLPFMAAAAILRHRRHRPAPLEP